MSEASRQYAPKFYKEVNTVMTLKGINPNGMTPSLFIVVLLAPLGIWWPILPALMFGLWLSRKMAVEPKYHIETIRHIINGKRWFSTISEPWCLISILGADGRDISMSEWGGTVGSHGG